MNVPPPELLAHPNVEKVYADDTNTQIVMLRANGKLVWGTTTGITKMGSAIMNGTQTQTLSKPVPNPAEIRRAFDALGLAGRIVELRAFSENESEGTWSGFYNDGSIVADSLELSLRENIPNVYWTVQAIDPSRLFSDIQMNASRTGCGFGSLTNDKMVWAYVRLPIDVDPVRPAHTSATDDEKAEAEEVAHDVRAYLTSKGITSLFADSGNGFHILPLINLPVSEESKTLIRDLLNGLARKFNTKTAEIDVKLFNPSRILKAYGTVARKGEHTEERPWRVSHIIDASAQTVVTEAQLRALLADLPIPEVVVTPKIDINDDSLIGDHRNDTLTSIAGSLHDKDLTGEDLFDVLMNHNNRRCKPPLDEREVRTIANSISRYPTGSEKKKKSQVLMNGVPAGSSTPEVSPPPVSPVTISETGNAALDLVSKMQQEFEEASAAANQADEDYQIRLDEIGEYPLHIWEGTPLHEYAILACGDGTHENFIPPAFHVNCLLTVVGAVCGHRIVYAPTLSKPFPANFYSILLSDYGSQGKNSAVDWSHLCFDKTCLLYQSGLRMHKNIGAYHNSFGSGSALIDSFAEYPSILQEYPELTTLTEKFKIDGSGEAFLDQVLNGYDSTTPRWGRVRGKKLPPILPSEINNSLLGGTIVKKWEEKIQGDQYETLIQRLNIVYSAETRTVPTLYVPDVTGIRRKLMDRVGLLEEYKLIWHYSPEAEEILSKWHYEIEERKKAAHGKDNNEHEAYGRIQVFVHRIVGHLALWLAPPPMTADGKVISPSYYHLEGMNEKDGSPVPYVRKAEGMDKDWIVEAPKEWLSRAIEAAEYLIQIRLRLVPPAGAGTRGKIQNQIKKWVQILQNVKWPALQKRAGLYKHDYDEAEKCLLAVAKSGVIDIKHDPTDPSNHFKWVITWTGGGDGLSGKTWRENRGGRRAGAGRKK